MCARKYLVDHATLWNRNGCPLLLMSQVYAPTLKRDEPGQVREWWTSEVHDYARRFGVRVWIGRPDHALSFWKPNHCTPVLYGLGVDPSEFTHISDADKAKQERRRAVKRGQASLSDNRRAKT